MPTCPRKSNLKWFPHILYESWLFMTQYLDYICDKVEQTFSISSE